MPVRPPYALVAALTLAVVARAQSGAPRKLAAPTAAYDQEFTGIEGVRELKDGRLVVLDAQDKAIHLIDLKNGRGTRTGRDGDGPGEYRLPLEIWPIGGDSSLVRDMARFGKLMVITPTGEIGGFESMLDSALSTRSFNPTAADQSGRLYTLEYTGEAGIRDSGRIVRWDRRRGTRDTLARFTSTLNPPTAVNEADVFRDATGRIVGYRPGPPRAFTAFNAWAVAGDGRVAIVQGGPYRVTYISPSGARTVGPTVAFQPVPVTEADKEAWRADAARPRPSISQTRGGPVVASFRKSPVPDNVIWADALPPFPQQGVRFASDGMLWVRRSTKAGAAPLYDLFDASGKVAHQLELPMSRKLVGFGAGVVYLARVDADDLHYLERYRLPGK